MTVWDSLDVFPRPMKKLVTVTEGRNLLQYHRTSTVTGQRRESSCTNILVPVSTLSSMSVTLPQMIYPAVWKMGIEGQSTFLLLWLQTFEQGHRRQLKYWSTHVYYQSVLIFTDETTLKKPENNNMKLGRIHCYKGEWILWRKRKSFWWGSRLGKPTVKSPRR